MDDARIEKLVALLGELTEQNKLNWSETESEDAFLVQLKTNSISLNRKLNAENINFNYFVEIINENGKKITSMVILHETRLWNDANTLFYKVMDRALNAEAVMDEIIEELESFKFAF